MLTRWRVPAVCVALLLLPCMAGIVQAAAPVPPPAAFRGGAYDGYDLAGDTVRMGYPHVIHVGGVSNVTETSAWFNGYLVATGSAPASVQVYWGTNDGATVTGDWPAAPLDLGPRSAGEALGVEVTGLAPGRRYYYRFQATNTAGQVAWANATVIFDTLSPPVVDTGHGAAPVSAQTATLHGHLTGGVEAEIAILWGTDTNLWSDTTNLGTRAEGRFSITLGGLTGNTPYYYRCTASNLSGTAQSAILPFHTSLPAAAPFSGGACDGFARDSFSGPLVPANSGLLMFIR